MCFLQDFLHGSHFRQQLFDFPLPQDFVAESVSTDEKSSDILTLESVIPELFEEFQRSLPCSAFAFGELNCTSFLPHIAKPVLFQLYASTGKGFTSLHVDYGGAALNLAVPTTRMTSVLLFFCLLNFSFTYIQIFFLFSLVLKYHLIAYFSCFVWQVWAAGGDPSDECDIPTSDDAGLLSLPMLEQVSTASKTQPVAIWTFFAASDLSELERYLQDISTEKSTPLSVYRNNYFLNAEDLHNLKTKRNVRANFSACFSFFRILTFYVSVVIIFRYHI